MPVVKIGVVYRLIIHTTLVKSCNAYPLSTALIRTACSLMLVALGCPRKSVTAERASCFKCDDTESSRSYTAKSTFSERDLFNIFRDDPGTAFLVSLQFISSPGHSAYHRAVLSSRQKLSSSFSVYSAQDFSKSISILFIQVSRLT